MVGAMVIQLRVEMILFAQVYSEDLLQQKMLTMYQHVLPAQEPCSQPEQNSASVIFRPAKNCIRKTTPAKPLFFDNIGSAGHCSACSLACIIASDCLIKIRYNYSAGDPHMKLLII